MNSGFPVQYTPPATRLPLAAPVSSQILVGIYGPTLSTDEYGNLSITAYIPYYGPLTPKTGYISFDSAGHLLLTDSVYFGTPLSPAWGTVSLSAAVANGDTLTIVGNAHTVIFTFNAGSITNDHNGDTQVYTPGSISSTIAAIILAVNAQESYTSLFATAVSDYLTIFDEIFGTLGNANALAKTGTSLVVTGLSEGTDAAGGHFDVSGDITTLGTISCAALTVNSNSVVPALNQSIYASGTAYTLTNTAALIHLGTTDPTLTIAVTGYYELNGRVRYDLNGATFASSRTVTTKIRRTSGTPADIANTSCGLQTGVTTTITATLAIFDLPPVIVSLTAGDVISLFGNVSVVPTAGSLQAIEASLTAVMVNHP